MGTCLLSRWSKEMIHWELSVLVGKNSDEDVVDIECSIERTWASWCLEHEEEDEVLPTKDELEDDEESNGLDDIPF